MSTETPKLPTEIKVCDGKYTFVLDDDVAVTAILRYGLPWSTERPYQLKYGKAISALASEYIEVTARRDMLANAAKALLDDVRRRYPGEALRCPYMIALDEALPA